MYTFKTSLIYFFCNFTPIIQAHFYLLSLSPSNKNVSSFAVFVCKSLNFNYLKSFIRFKAGILNWIWLNNNSICLQLCFHYIWSILRLLTYVKVEWHLRLGFLGDSKFWLKIWWYCSVHIMTSTVSKCPGNFTAKRQTPCFTVSTILAYAVFHCDQINVCSSSDHIIFNFIFPYYLERT